MVKREENVELELVHLLLFVGIESPSATEVNNIIIIVTVGGS